MSEKIEIFELKIYDMFGKKVQADVQRTDVFTISRGNLSSGVYFYTLNAGENSGSGKIVIMPR